MGFFASIIVGTLAGWIVGRVMSGSGYGFLTNLILGLIGSAVGGWLGSVFLQVDLTTGFNLTTILTAVVGGIIVVAAYRLFTGKRPA
jgi:uncharacterized membrane protein YeaQ/YmgE (transglycosylase-associated protein family)